MTLRTLVALALAAAALARLPDAGQSAPARQGAAFQLEEVTIATLIADQQAGRRTARAIAELYLGRIAALDQAGPSLRSVIELNPDALAIADGLDAERAAKGLRGPLHGVPVPIACRPLRDRWRWRDRSPPRTRRSCRACGRPAR
jgi:amidase